MVRLKNSNGNTEQTYFHVHTSQTRQCEGRDRIIQFPFCRVQEDRGFWRVHVLAPARHQHPQPLVPWLLAQADRVRGAAARGEVLWPGGYQVIDGVNKYLLSPHPSSPDPNSRIRNQIGLNKAPFNNKETEFALHCFIHVAVLVSSESESSEGYVTTSPGSFQLPCSHRLSRQHLTMLTVTHVFINICISTANRYLKIFKYLDIFKSSGH